MSEKDQSGEYFNVPLAQGDIEYFSVLNLFFNQLNYK